MPQLTTEQKEQLKMSRRASMRIEETWSLYCMFLSQDKRPAEALERAQEAVAIWVEWMDQNDVEPPEIERRDIGEYMSDAMQKMADTIKNASAPIPFYLSTGPCGMPNSSPEVDSLATQSPEPASETGTPNTKEPRP